MDKICNCSVNHYLRHGPHADKAGFDLHDSGDQTAAWYLSAVGRRMVSYDAPSRGGK